MADERQELLELRRLDELERKAAGGRTDTRNWLQRTVNPRRENFPEYAASGTPEQVLAAEQQLRGGNPSLGQDRYGNPTLVTDRGTFYPNRPGPSLNDVPNALSGFQRIAKEVAPFIAGGGATNLMKAIPAAATQAGIGLVTETMDQTNNALQGREVNTGKLVTTPAFAALGELGSRAVLAAAKPIIARALGTNTTSNLVNPDGTISDDALKALSDNGIDQNQLDDMALQELSRMKDSGALTREQAERFNLFRQYKMNPLRAQVTRTADDFMAQQEAAKTSTSVRSALEGQEQTISQAFDTQIRGTGGNAVTSGSPVADAVLNKATQLDAEISSLYNQARQAANGEKNIGLNQLAQNLRARAPSNELSGGVIRAIRGDLMERGIIDRNFRVVGKVDVNTAEEVRKVINSHWTSTNDTGRNLLRQFKDSLDADVLKMAGDDVYQQARAAKTAFEEGLRPTSLSKFDTNERSLVRNILENKIKAQDVFEQSVLSKSWKESDLRELRNYLIRGSQEQRVVGLKAWDDLRAETLDWIKSQAFSNALDQTEQASMRSGSIGKAMDRIGDGRLEILFKGEEREFLRNMRRLEQLRQPVPRTGDGRGPSAQGIAMLTEEVRKQAAGLPMVGKLFDIFLNQSRAINALSNPVTPAMNAAQNAAARRVIVTPGAAAGVVVEDRLMQEN